MDSKDSAWLKSKLLGWFLKILTVLGPLAEGAFILRLWTLTTWEWWRGIPDETYSKSNLVECEGEDQLLVTIRLYYCSIILDQVKVRSLVIIITMIMMNVTYSETVLQSVLVTDVETLTSTQVQQGVERHNWHVSCRLPRLSGMF